MLLLGLSVVHTLLLTATYSCYPQVQILLQCTQVFFGTLSPDSESHCMQRKECALRQFLINKYVVLGCKHLMQMIPSTFSLQSDTQPLQFLGTIPKHLLSPNSASRMFHCKSQIQSPGGDSLC